MLKLKRVENRIVDQKGEKQEIKSNLDTSRKMQFQKK